MAYEMRISDWSSDVCSSDLQFALRRPLFHIHPERIDATGPSARACCLKDRELCATRGRQLRARFSDPRGGNFQIVILLQGPVGPKLRFWPIRRTFWARGKSGSATCRERVCMYG